MQLNSGAYFVLKVLINARVCSFALGLVMPATCEKKGSLDYDNGALSKK